MQRRKKNLMNDWKDELKERKTENCKLILRVLRNLSRSSDLLCGYTSSETILCLSWDFFEMSHSTSSSCSSTDGLLSPLVRTSLGSWESTGGTG